MMLQCLSCSAETTNGLALCELCRRKALADLEFIPVYFRNLARWRRPARPNGSLGTRNQWLIQRGETEASRIDRALERAGNDLATWTRALADDRPGFAVSVPELALSRPNGSSVGPNATDVLLGPQIGSHVFESETDQVTAICWSLSTAMHTIATLEWCGELVSDLSRHERSLRSLTETCVPGWYAGTCRRDIGGRCCGADTYVVPGLTWVTCGTCGSTTYARDHLNAVLDEARDWVATPKRLAEAIVALVDTEASVERLRKRITNWGNRDQVEGRRHIDGDGDPCGPRRYRFGDVLDLLQREGATRDGATEMAG